MTRPRAPVETIVDGRRRKGQLRRGALVEATLRVIERAGVAAVTQRTVAREAQLPPSAVTYHFPGVDALLVATLVSVNDDYVERFAALPDDDDLAIAGLAELIAGSDRGPLAAECELFLLAARRPELRDELARWNRTLAAFVARYTDDLARCAGAAAAIDGLFLRRLTTDDRLDAGDIHRILASLLGRPG